MTRRKRKGKKLQLMSRKKKTVSSKRTEVEEEAYRKLRVALQNVYAINKEQPRVKCIGCDTYFYSEEGMRTYFQHAHTNVKEIAVRGNNESKEDATLKDDSAAETQKDCSQNNERATVSIPENTDETELPDIVPPSQSVTCGRKHTRNGCDSNVHNKKQTTGSPSPSKRRLDKESSKTPMEEMLVTKNVPKDRLRKKKSEVSDDTTPTLKHFTRSQRSSTQRHGDEMTPTTVKQGKRKANSKEFQTKPIPEKKRKNEVDANEIIKKHTNKDVEQNRKEQRYQKSLRVKHMQHEVREVWKAMKSHTMSLATNQKTLKRMEKNPNQLKL